MKYLTSINEYNNYYTLINSDDEIYSKFFSDLHSEKFTNEEIKKISKIIGFLDVDENGTILRCQNSIYESDNYSIYIDVIKMSDEWFIIKQYFEDNDILSLNQSPTIEEVISYKCDQIEGVIECLNHIVKSIG